MVSSGSWVHTSDVFEGKQYLLSLLGLGAKPCPSGSSASQEYCGGTGGRSKGRAMGEIRGGLLCCLHHSIPWHLTAVKKAFNPNVLAKLQPA